jgi:hypothetical protein
LHDLRLRILRQEAFGMPIRDRRRSIPLSESKSGELFVSRYLLTAVPKIRLLSFMSSSTHLWFYIVMGAILAVPRLPAQKTVGHDALNPAPEMSRLAKALAGNWDTTETMEKGELFPHGGSRHGTVHARLIAGGTTLVYEVHSNGSAGRLDGMLVIWWDKEASLYAIFICFNNPDHPCKLRGSAHWEGNSFVNDYEEMVSGRRTAWRDSFTFTPISHRLVAAIKENGVWKALITTKATRR